MSSRYHELYAAWKRDPETFWAEAAHEIDWYKPWDKVFDPYAGQYGRWFVGGECNTAWNCLDRHVERGRGRQKALIYDSPVTKTTRTTVTPNCATRWRRWGVCYRTWGSDKATAWSSICR